MKKALIALLASTTLFATCVSAKADSIGFIYIPSPAADARLCYFYTLSSGQWYAIDQHDPDADEQLANVYFSKSNGLQVFNFSSGSVCGTPRSAFYAN